MDTLTAVGPYLGVAGLLVAFVIYTRIKAGEVGSELMEEISTAIHEGAMAFLKRESSILLILKPGPRVIVIDKLSLRSIT